MEKYLLQMKNIEKDYFGNKVLKGVDLNLKAGEIHCLLGENGAGKSTLMNILFGMEVIHNTGGYSGEVIIDGKVIDFNSPKAAMEANIGMVHQEFMLIPSLTIAENIKLNREITTQNPLSRVCGDRLKSLDRKTINSDSRKALDKVGMGIEEYTRVAGLPVGHMQFVEIAREIDKEHLEILVFDEPTAVLTEKEAENLLNTMRKLASEGIAILFITHRLDEVINVSDRITILRDGELITSKETKDTSVEEIAELMVGRKIELTQKDKKAEQNREIILDINNLHVDMPGEQVKGIDLKIKKGEILGIGGLAGQGKIGLANGIMGLYPSTGEVQYRGETFPLNSTAEALKSDIAFVSEDRRGVGLIVDSSIEMNIAFTALKVQNKFLKDFKLFTMLDKHEMHKHAEQMIEEFDIRCTGPKQKAGRLSGGNQQKVCIARALTQKPDLLFISEPTRGIDIGAKKLVLDLLVKLNKELGMTVVITSSELAELRSISDRIAIISEGTISGVLEPDASDTEYGLLMSGVKK